MISKPDKKITIAVSGRKFSGKTSLCKYVQAHYANQWAVGLNFKQEQSGDIVWYGGRGEPVIGDYITSLTVQVDRCVKIFNFADNLKEICVNVLGLRPEQVYGTEEQKNSPTKYAWENLPSYIRWVFGGRQVIGFADNAEPIFMTPEKLQSFKEYTKRETDEELYCDLSSNPNSYYSPCGLKTGHMTAREAMQVIGTNVMRQMFDHDIWCNSTIGTIDRSDVTMALIADMRFRSEFHAVQKAGGYVIRLEREVFSDTHDSEVDFDGFDFTQYPRTLVIPAHYGIEEKNRTAIEWIDKIIAGEI